MMTKKEKAEIMNKVSIGLDSISHGTITIELRGPGRPVDVVKSDRTRIELESNKKIKSQE